MELRKHFQVVSVRQNSGLKPCVVNGSEVRLVLIQGKFYSAPRRKPELSGIDPSGARKKPVFHGGVGMIHGNKSCSHGIDEFFSNVVGFGAGLQAYSNLVTGQKLDVLFAVDIDTGRRSPRMIIWRSLNPKLRKMAEVRPCV